jgi:hypothetical protein
MTEVEWLACDDPVRLLDCLRGKVSDRKMRLCAVACCRRIWHFLPCPRCRQAVQCAELYADGLVGEREREEATGQALDAYVPLGAAADAVAPGSWSALDSLVSDALRDRYAEVYQRAYQEARRNGGDAGEAWEASMAALAAYHTLVAGQQVCWSLISAGKAVSLACRADDVEAAYSPADPAETAAQCRLVADVFGNPFRAPLMKPAWRTSDVLALAEAAYHERDLPAGMLDPNRLLVLADALEEAGCALAAILDHLRGPGPHVRGCHILDLLLSRE